MRKNNSFFVIFFFYNVFLFSQVDYKHGFLNYVVDTVAKNSVPSYKLYRQQIHKKYDTLFNNKEESNKFAKYLIAGLRDRFENGNIYTNWNYAQDYLNKIVQKITPNTKDSINIKIIRSTDVNAFMTATGQAYITVGFLANALNEAEIAATLGHEYGHHIHLDHYKQFKDYLINEKHKKVGNMLAGYGGGIYGLIATSNMYGDFRDMEREADNVSIDITKNAGYNLLSWVNVLKRFKAIEDNDKKEKGYVSPSGLHFKDYRYGFGFGFYFRDHPPTTERIDVAQKAANKSDTINSKYFQVDEAAFNKMKLQAVDECINLLLEQQEFEDCIELCYKQLLFYPNDEFYLFYINEALRRYLIVNPKEEDKFFITGRYYTSPKYIPKNKLPVYIRTSTQIKPGDFSISQSVFYHYEYLEFGDKDKVLIKLPLNELTQTDTLEFITNKDAFSYFTAKQEKLKQSSVSWVKNCSSNSLEDVEINSSESFLNRYNDIKNDVLTINKKAESNIAIPCILAEVNYTGRASFVSRNDFNTDSLPRQSRRFLKTGLESPYAYFNLNTLTPAEKNTMLNVIAGMSDMVKDYSSKIEKIEKVNLPLKILAPEVVAILNKYKLQQFMVVGIQVTDAISVAQIGVPLSFTITFNMYYVDFKNGFLSHSLETSGIASTPGLEFQIKNLNQHLPLLRH